MLPEDCYYWGFIKSVDTDAKTLVFDLARFESTGEEDYEFELVNNNPLLRTLEVGEALVVNSCPPAEDESVPSECGDPAGFEHFTLDVLAGWVANGYEFWSLFLVDDRITLVEQWWHP
jgi:hypothetical protein